MTAAPPIDVSKSRYDLSTYYGRWRHFVSVTSPLTLLASTKELTDARQLLEDYAAGKRTDLYGKDEVVYRAKQLVDSSIHPDNGEPVPLPFRMSAFVPTNLIVVGGMLSSASLPSTIFWQVANQSLNVCVNYANANKTVPMSTSEVATAYVTATSASVAIAVGLTKGVPRLRFLSPAAKSIATRLVPFFSVAGAGCVNVACMRYKEIRDGIDIFPPRGQDEKKSESLGKSPKAGQTAVGQTAASRVLTNAPTLILPPLAMAWLERRGTFGGPRGKQLKTVANLGLIGFALLVFLPPAIAVFPQRGSIATSKLEGRFHDLKDPRSGRPLETVEFSKGL